MTTAEHIETIDRLRACGFPKTRTRSGQVTSGPGYHLAELGESRWYGDEDPADRIEGEERVSAEYGALAQALTGRWGAADLVWTRGMLERAGTGDRLAEPWQELSGTTDHLHLWRVAPHWVALYAAQWGADHSPQLMAAVTVTDPP
ncbi:hypothetical protein [Streptomyces sp. NPDC089799]|uniref:hypothetical protein n=1 Tax=Streptomyces sp. NPDC089799 TaxID=3155066 RepID=UPI00341AFBBE